MKTMTKTTVLAGIAGLASALSAATLEVGANRPYRTIQSAAVAKPGDTVLIDPGVYREWVKPANAGTKEAPITGAEVVTGWTIAPDRRYSVKNAHRPDFKPVDTARLGKNVLGRQPFENRDGTPYV